MTLFLHVLMLFLLSGGSAEVVQDFEQACGQFFAGGKSPTTFTEKPQYKQICQTLNNVHYYATYYDTANRIPVYSAYRFAGIMGNDRLDKWHIEPQLDDNNAGPNILSDVCVDNLRGDHQALNEDYEKTSMDERYERGHLAPVYQAESKKCACATFTLTNAAPQDLSFNRGQWRVLEEKMAEELSQKCSQYSVFIVTGVVPGTSKLKNRVNVPSHFWTAFCCLDQNNRCQFSDGFIGVNKNITPNRMTVNALETELAILYNVNPFKVFNV